MNRYLPLMLAATMSVTLIAAHAASAQDSVLVQPAVTVPAYQPLRRARASWLCMVQGIAAGIDTYNRCAQTSGFRGAIRERIQARRDRRRARREGRRNRGWCR